MNAHDWWLEGHEIIPRRWKENERFEPTRLGSLVFGWHRRTRWLRPYFWACIWRAPTKYTRVGEIRDWGDLERWRVRRCRLRGHPNGEIFYNPGGFEPDHRCQDCLEVIG